jgi:hypothetical protein
VTEAFICAYVRTPFGRYAGALAGLRPDAMAGHVLRALVDQSGIDPADLDDVILGNANHAGVRPDEMGLGPVPSSRRALKRAGLTVEDMDTTWARAAFRRPSAAPASPGSCRTPAASARLAGSAVDDGLVRALGHVGVERVLDHSERGLLRPREAGKLRSRGARATRLAIAVIAAPRRTAATAPRPP